MVNITKFSLLKSFHGIRAGSRLLTKVASSSFRDSNSRVIMASTNTTTTLTFNTMVHLLTIKLSSSNYLLWRNQVSPLLHSQNLFGYVDGSISKPSMTVTSTTSATSTTTTTSTENPKFTEWIQMDQLVLSLLLSTLTEESMSVVVGLSTSRDVWFRLETTFSHKSKSRELRLRDELQTMKKHDKSLSDFSREFRALCDQLAAMGRPIDDLDKVHWFLRGLGSSFSTFSTNQ